MFNSSPSRKTERQPGNTSNTSLIAEGTHITGDVAFSGALHLDGCIKGVVKADEDGDAVFTLSADGRVEGEIHVANAVINGCVEGNIVVSGRLELAAQARVDGDVHYRVLEMAAGARINGRMLHQGEEPQRQLAGPEHGTPAPVEEAEAALAES